MGAAQRTGEPPYCCCLAYILRTRKLTRLRRPQCIIPKTGNPEHMRMNRELGITLTEQELADIDALDGNLPPKDQYQ